ncbi:MAG: serine hydrolase domain-containing protein [Jaaginema sp. PMC 1079.18]|nr:serine hydrolase domain-containing protein [Jaaginema sp. PMC 1080.18]MEC4850621.1 serine hydrolase domain-containing protein [Jaaginema sp. PMC 1079.18]MEC4867818.1 serine hydrolase domain-containing protein [Jaaginema sp. PMC 1078.18]
MKKIWCINLSLTALLFVFGCSRPTTDSAISDSETLTQNVDSTELRRTIESQVDQTLVENGPGVAVLVMENGEILHAEGYGLRDIDAQLPITQNTLFDLASVSKQMTALGILILMERGELDVENAVTDYLPDFVDPNPDDPITVADLLHHTSGLADYTGGNWEGSDTEFANLTLEDHLLWLNEQESVSDRGTEFEYNNSNYALLALMIQRVSEKPFPAFMQEEIFAPLGMSQTLVYQNLGQIIPQQANGYAVSEDGEVTESSFPTVITGDGNVFSSIADLANYDRGLRDNTLISAETLALAFTPGEATEDYGFGWEVTETYVHHDGSWEGTSTYYRFYLDPAISIVVLSNDENYDPEELVDAIAITLDLE